MKDLRPLDPLNSIKIKLGVLVAASVCVTALAVWAGLHAGFAPAYTLPVAVAAALAVTQVLAHGMTSPLREMTAAARAMARGDYSRRVRATSRDEVGDLARAFNRMAEDLAHADRERRELVANVSHELRTPISAIRAVLENVVDGVVAADGPTLRTMLAQIERLGRLVTQLLDLSRIEAGAVRLEREEFGVAELLEAVIGEARIARPAVRYRCDVTPASLTAVADRERLHQVVANLLDNAGRHSPAGGTVTVTARPGDRLGAALLDVADEGPGIPPEDRIRVFERFTRGGVPGGSDGGTGLGLAIARWAIDLHGGDIGVVESAHGCRIRIALPGGT